MHQGDLKIGKDSVRVIRVVRARDQDHEVTESLKVVLNQEVISVALKQIHPSCIVAGVSNLIRKSSRTSLACKLLGVVTELLSALIGTEKEKKSYHH